MSRKLLDYDDMRGGLKILHSHDEYSAWVQFPFSSFTLLFNQPPILFLTRATPTIQHVLGTYTHLYLDLTLKQRY